MVLTLQERIFLVQAVLSKGEKYSQEVQDSFAEKFGADRVPHRHCVTALLDKFKKTGSVADRVRSGRPTVINEGVLHDVTNKLQRSPKKSLRRLSQETGISLGSIHKAVHKLKFRPYKVHDLTPPDFYLWGKLKGAVYANNPHTIEQLKDNIRETIHNIPREELERVFANMRRRVELCLGVNGGHFQQLM